ncbi:MAG: hypothetical protein PHH93_06780 [Prolixibacteraceae bacterium]|nr:hypothetical protein [Prolixibacteraceae bacterium]
MISKTLKLITSLGIIIISLSVYGQVDPVEKEILNFDESKSSLISKGRKWNIRQYALSDNRIRRICQRVGA